MVKNLKENRVQEIRELCGIPKQSFKENMLKKLSTDDLRLLKGYILMAQQTAIEKTKGETICK